MGDQISSVTSGRLYFIPFDVFQRVLGASVPMIQKVEIFANMCRINALFMIAKAGSGHIGSSFSSMEIMTWWFLNDAAYRLQPGNKENNIFFSSKGHDAPALYSVLMGLGQLDFSKLHQLRRINGLPGHPDISTPNIVTNTGSLGMGISKAKGMILSGRLTGHPTNVTVLLGDGELQEGQIWESLVTAVNLKMHELTVIIDHNKLQSDTFVTQVSDLGDLYAKFQAFGCRVFRCDGNNVKSLSQTMEACMLETNKPKVIIADTVKGKGVSFMEHTSLDSDVEYYKFHSGAPKSEQYSAALDELVGNLSKELALTGIAGIELETEDQKISPLGTPTKYSLIKVYTDALIRLSEKHKTIVALDADLVLDTGLIPFKERFPERFFECGIAEQDMVSQAGGMALTGLLPVAHSFASFLTARPIEQIYNNASEGKKILYIGSLAGVLPAGPGHSHQAIRDIASMSSIPNMDVIEPSLPDEVDPLLEWAIEKSPNQVYLRLVSVPFEFDKFKADPFELTYGHGRTLIEGKGVLLICHGPTFLEEATAVCQSLAEEHFQIGLATFAWLNYVNIAWLEQQKDRYHTLLILENHYTIGGIYSVFSQVVAEHNFAGLSLKRVTLTGFPECGSNDEVTKHHGFDRENLIIKVKNLLQ